MRNDADDKRGQDDIVAVPIADWMDEGLPVYDVDGAKIGHVRHYDLNAGYMEVETGGLARQELFVPFHLLQSITPREIYLKMPKDGLSEAHLLPPPAQTVVEKQTASRTRGAEVMLTQEMRSGYDGHPVQVASVPLDTLAHTLAVGLTVLDVDDTYVSEVTRVDTACEQLTVRGSLTDEVFRTIPFGVVARVDPEQALVKLLVLSASIPTDREC